MNTLPLTGDGLLSQTTFVKSGKSVPTRRRVKPTLTVFDQFNIALVSLRERRRMKQTQIIEAAGLSPRTVGSAEKGENIRIDTLDAMLAAMGATLLEFCLAVAAAQGIEVPDVQRIEERERQRDKFKEVIAGDSSAESGEDLREINRRIEVLEAFRNGVEAGSKLSGKRGSD